MGMWVKPNERIPPGHGSIIFKARFPTSINFGLLFASLTITLRVHILKLPSFLRRESNNLLVLVDKGAVLVLRFDAADEQEACIGRRYGGFSYWSFNPCVDWDHSLVSIMADSGESIGRTIWFVRVGETRVLC